MSITPTDLHRAAYATIVANPAGVTRHELVCALFKEAAHLERDSSAYQALDRKTRGILEEVRTLAATHAHPELGPLVIGFDPQARDAGAYVYAQSVKQADRIMAPQESRIKSIAAAWRAQQKAAEHLGRVTPPELQDVLFTRPARVDWRRG